MRQKVIIGKKDEFIKEGSFTNFLSIFCSVCGNCTCYILCDFSNKNTVSHPNKGNDRFVIHQHKFSNMVYPNILESFEKDISAKGGAFQQEIVFRLAVA